jgi:hypothetical protein
MNKGLEQLVVLREEQDRLIEKVWMQTGKVKVQKTIERDGKTFTQTFWVTPEQAKTQGLKPVEGLGVGEPFKVNHLSLASKQLRTPAKVLLEKFQTYGKYTPGLSLEEWLEYEGYVRHYEAKEVSVDPTDLDKVEAAWKEGDEKVVGEKLGAIVYSNARKMGYSEPMARRLINIPRGIKGNPQKEESLTYKFYVGSKFGMGEDILTQRLQNEYKQYGTQNYFTSRHWERMKLMAKEGKAFFDWYHKMTTELMRRRYGDKITVFRGIHGKLALELKERVQNLPPETPIKLSNGILSSFTLEEGVANDFGLIDMPRGKYTYKKDEGAVLKTTVSPEDVFFADATFFLHKFMDKEKELDVAADQLTFNVGDIKWRTTKTR